MSNFNNNEYEKLVLDLIGDIFYSATSYRGKVSDLRQYAEIIVRKILDIFPQKEITLGNKEIQKKLHSLPNYNLIEQAVKTLQTMGNKATHTQYRDEVTDKDFDEAIECLFDLLAYLLIRYFVKYEFGSNNKVVFAFSILPPIIRYKVLIFLHSQYPNNSLIVDKLVLATIKAFNAETATNWIEDNKETLLLMRSSPEVFSSKIELQNQDLINVLNYIMPINMYQVCKDKVSIMERVVLNDGLMYSSFESALPYYKMVGIIQDDTQEIQEFNDVMDFLYMGRKAREELCSTINNYIVLDAIEKPN